MIQAQNQVITHTRNNIDPNQSALSHRLIRVFAVHAYNKTNSASNTDVHMLYSNKPTIFRYINTQANTPHPLQLIITTHYIHCMKETRLRFMHACWCILDPVKGKKKRILCYALQRITNTAA